MTEREQAADHLKVIRSLMERATVYRTISWPTALFRRDPGRDLWRPSSILREQIAISGDGGGSRKMISEESWVLLLAGGVWW